ncbi:unnamed protein product [Callosobruchus maculatus]|uniref:C2H2-type domain-containing protein n=1 Tax=Callosobruchus maculatus TaxID=64391 RepID=A0A653D0W8_CALMS|nr:unnamed protein product [Callosobruchus maculatus]
MKIVGLVYVNIVMPHSNQNDGWRTMLLKSIPIFVRQFLARYTNNDFEKHLLKHSDAECTHCHKICNSKQSLNYHILKKHPDCVTSVTERIYCCSNCTYKTTVKRYYKEHLLRHSSSRLCICKHCNGTFKSKRSLDDHILKQHGDFSASVSHKLYKCCYCDYKTVKKCSIDEHMLRHPEAASTHKLFSCEHCKVAYKRKLSLDNHIVKNHPDLISSVTRTIHECSHCPFKTLIKEFYNKHMSHHSSDKASI